MSRTTARLVFLVTAAFFAVFFVWPVLQIVKGGFIDSDGHLTFGFLKTLLSDPTYVDGAPQLVPPRLRGDDARPPDRAAPGVHLGQVHLPLKGFLNSAILVPMILPPFVGAIGIKQIFGQYGAVNALIVALHLKPHGWTFDWFAANQFWGIAVVEALSLYPIIYLNAVAALANIDPAMEEAAQNLGCTGLRRFWKITLPLIHPGLFAGGTIVFIWIFTELGTPLVFDYNRGDERPDLSTG
jgi:iron(III) transport system permease protein